MLYRKTNAASKIKMPAQAKRTTQVMQGIKRNKVNFCFKKRLNNNNPKGESQLPFVI